MWRKTTRRELPPITLTAARTLGSASVRVSPRTNRAGASQDNPASTAISKNLYSERGGVGREDGRDENEQEDNRDGQEDVHDAHHDRVHRLAEITGDGPPHDPQERGNNGHGKPDLDRDLAAGHEPAQDVVTIVVGAQHMTTGRGRGCSRLCSCLPGRCGKEAARRKQKSSMATTITMPMTASLFFVNVRRMSEARLPCW